MYADDLKIYAPVCSTHDRNNLQLAINALQDWSATWNLPIALNKTSVMHLGRSNLCFDYTLDGTTLSVNHEVRDLGFVYDNKLSFDKHCEIITNKAKPQMFNMFKCLTSKDPSVLLKAYKTYIRPILEYGTTVFNPSKKK